MLGNITLNQVVAIILSVSGFLVSIDKIYDIWKKHNPGKKLEDADKQFNVALTNIMEQLNTHDEKIKKHDELLGNDNEHLKRHDIQIADIQHQNEIDRYYNIRSFKVIIQKLSGNATDDDLKRVYNELDEYEHTSLTERIERDKRFEEGGK